MTQKMLEAQKRGKIEKRTHWVGFEEYGTVLIRGPMARHREERIWQQLKFNGNCCRFSTVRIRGAFLQP